MEYEAVRLQPVGRPFIPFGRNIPVKVIARLTKLSIIINKMRERIPYDELIRNPTYDLLVCEADCLCYKIMRKWWY